MRQAHRALLLAVMCHFLPTQAQADMIFAQRPGEEIDAANGFVPDTVTTLVLSDASDACAEWHTSAPNHIFWQMQLYAGTNSLGGIGCYEAHFSEEAQKSCGLVGTMLWQSGDDPAVPVQGWPFCGVRVEVLAKPTNSTLEVALHYLNDDSSSTILTARLCPKVAAIDLERPRAFWEKPFQGVGDGTGRDIPSEIHRYYDQQCTELLRRAHR